MSFDYLIYGFLKAMAKGSLPLALELLKSNSSKDHGVARLAWVGEVAGEWKDKDQGLVRFTSSN